MSPIEIFLNDEQATVEAGAQFGKLMQDAAVIYLQGVLGAGKTTFCRGVLSAFGYSGAVKSPTYTLVEPYQLNERTIYHFDLYRLGEPEELEYMGIRDYFQGDNICLIEWPVKGQGYIAEADFTIELAPENTGRTLKIYPHSEYGKKICTALKADVAN